MYYIDEEDQRYLNTLASFSSPFPFCWFSTSENMSIWWALQTLAFLLLFTAVSADDVVVLTEANFEQEVGKDVGALVEFYAPWFDSLAFCVFRVRCGHVGWLICFDFLEYSYVERVWLEICCY